MPKILDDSIKFIVISLFCAGLLRDQIAQEIGIGNGTVSKYLDEFRKTIGNSKYNTIKEQGVYLRQRQIDVKAAVDGAKLIDEMNSFQMKKEDISSFLGYWSEIKTKNNPLEVLSEAVKILDIQKNTGMGILQARKQYEKMSQEIPALRAQKKEIDEEIADMRKARIETLQQNKTTDDELRQFVVIKAKLLKLGIKLSELPQYHDTLAEIKRRRYDVVSILDDLQEIKNLKEQIKKDSLVLDKYHHDTKSAKDELHHISVDLKSMRQKYKKYSTAIRLISEFIKNNQDPLSIIHWNKILQQNNMDLQKFDSKMKKYGNMLNFLHQIITKIQSLEKREDELQSSVSTLDMKRTELINHIDIADTMLNQTIENAKKEIDKMSSNPLRLITESKNPDYVLPVLLVFFKEMSDWMKNCKIDGKDVLRAVELLITSTEKMLKRK